MYKKNKVRKLVKVYVLRRSRKGTEFGGFGSADFFVRFIKLRILKKIT